MSGTTHFFSDLPEIPEFKNSQELETVLSEFDIEEDAQKLAALGRFAARFVPGPENPKSGASKIGGIPDFPESITWPVRTAFNLESEGGTLSYLSDEERSFLGSPQPLSFLAQINLLEISAIIPVDLGLPQKGMLYFFYDALRQGWGFDPADAPGFRVLYAPEASNLSPASQPHVEHAGFAFNEIPISPVPSFDPPPSEGIHFDALSMSPESKDLYRDFHDAFDEQRFEQSHDGTLEHLATMGHQLRGWPETIQNPMEVECALVSSGIYCGGPEGYATREAKAIRAQPNDWQLLFQIDSDDDAGMMWGDAGTVYFWIKEADLLRQNFDDVWVILQAS